jgi:predicted nucleic acid-binding protein
LTLFVLDTSVAVKWAIPSASRSETLTVESLQLLKRYTDGEINFIVPDIFWAEIGNVLWKGVRQRRWPQTTAEEAASAMRERNFFTVSSLELLPDALNIAFANDRSVYDCLYVALAIQFKIDMITADERLANALAARLPVKWLGAFAAE